MGLRGWLAVIAVAALAVSGKAWAQASCPIGAPQIITASTYTLSNNDECHALVFTNPGVSTVTAPNANKVAPGWQVLFFATGGGISISSAGSTSVINNQGPNAPVVVGQGQSGLLYGDGTNYWYANGTGFVMGPASGTAFSNLSGSNIFPGTLLANSPVVMVPNGVMQITNPASILPGTQGDIWKVCAGVAPSISASPTQQPAWLQILDWLGRPRKIPLC